MLQEKTIRPISLGLYTPMWILMGITLLMLVLTAQPLNHWVKVDRALMLTLNGSQGACTDQFWYAFSQFNTWCGVLILMVPTLWATCEDTTRRRLLFLLSVVALFCVLDQLSSGVIKPLVGRLRPSHDPAISSLLHYVNDYHGGRYGFVSGHATNIVGLCTWLCLTFRNRRVQAVFVVFAAMMCYSRIYLGVHYPGDILAGAVLGAVIAYLWFRLANRYFTIRAHTNPDALILGIGLTTSSIMVYSVARVYIM
jgi:undecaprenyl-diphosphatase